MRFQNRGDSRGVVRLTAAGLKGFTSAMPLHALQVIALLGALAAVLPMDCTSAMAETPAPPSVEASAEESRSSMSGREIYRRMLRNRYKRGVQEIEIVSTDPGGSEQTTVFVASLEDHRDENDDPTDGKNASLLIEVSSPFDMRHTRYLVVSKEPGPDDEFIYRPSERRVRRVDLKGTPLLGTDYTFRDLAYHDLEGATYKRLPDETHDGVPVFVVEALVTDTLDDRIHKSLSYLEQEHFVPLRVRYWDEYGVEVKELRAEHASIENFGSMWVARRSKMIDLLQRTESRSTVLSLDADPHFTPTRFSLRRLAQGR